LVNCSFGESDDCVGGYLSSIWFRRLLDCSLFCLDWWVFGDNGKIKAEQKGLKISLLLLILLPVLISPLESNSKFED